MREFLINLLRGDNHKLEIALFSGWHFLYLGVILGLIFLSAYLLRKSSEEKVTKVLNKIAIATLAVYVIDFFLQPLYTSSGQMDIDKLPFHICTLMGIVIVFAQFTKKNKWIKEIAVVLAMAGSLMYLCYPGSALGGISPFSYKVFQTFLFHGLLLSWGVLSLTTQTVKLKWKNIWHHLVALVIIALWATLGNNVYSSDARSYDWFFLTGSTFPFVPKFLMPVAVIVAIYGMVVIFYLLNMLGLKIANKNKLKNQVDTTEND